MDFHCFDWLTDVRGNPYGFKNKFKLFIVINFLFLLLHFFYLIFFIIKFFLTTRDLHEISIKMAFVEPVFPNLAITSQHAMNGEIDRLTQHEILNNIHNNMHYMWLCAYYAQYKHRSWSIKI